MAARQSSVAEVPAGCIGASRSRVEAGDWEMWEVWPEKGLGGR